MKEFFERRTILCPGIKILFVRNVRAAGRSIVEALHRYHGAGPTHAWSEYAELCEKKRAWFTFSVCRNPYTRALSLWHFRRHRRDVWSGKEGPGQFVKWLQRAFENEAEMGSQAEYLKPVRLDMVLRYEDIANEVKRLPFWTDAPLPHAHQLVHQRKPWQEYITPETKRLIQRWAGRDFEEFGYPLEPTCES